MDKPVIASIIISVLLIGGSFWLAFDKSGNADNAGDASAVSFADGKQIIIEAMTGFSPRVISAKAGMPTALRVKTNRTFDCSANLVIPKLSYQKILQPSGIEEIAIAPEQAQGTMRGLCAMGMYNFQIKFQ